jgi:hypothetical protein
MAMDDEDEEDYDDIPENHVYFEGPCTCDHEESEHDWGSCGVEGCDCEAGWTE